VALVIEDGTGVANANSYATLEQLRAYATARGVTLSAVDATLEPLAIKSIDYLESVRDKFKGDKLTRAQALQWPRANVEIDGFEVAENEIPIELLNAQCACVMELHAGKDLLPTSDGRILIRDKTGPLEQEWQSGTGSTSDSFPKVDALLQPLFKNMAGFFTYRA
jgi:hypothetical protein